MLQAGNRPRGHPGPGFEVLGGDAGKGDAAYAKAGIFPGFARYAQKGRFAGPSITDDDAQISGFRHMCEGRVLFAREGKTVGLRGFQGWPDAAFANTMMRALQRPPRPLRSLRRDVPDELDAVIRCALSKDPERRYPSAQDMLEALAEVPLFDEEDATAELARIDESSTTAIVTFRPAPWWRRMWSWLRYGGWRWA